MAARQACGLVLCSLLLFNIVLILSSAESADLTSRCPPQLQNTRYLKAAEWGKCYEFHVEERTWRTANSICGTKGGHLVTIKEERVQNFLLKALLYYRWPRNGLWIGATDKDKEMEWLWVTGERVNEGYSRWASGQPSCGFFCFEDCALMRWKEGGRWHDYRCNWLEDYSFICEYDMLPGPTTPTTTSTVSMSESTATTTTSATTSDVLPDNTTSIFSASLKRVLEYEYLLHVNREKEEEGSSLDNEKNNSDVMLTPAVMLQGVNGARAEQVQESISASASSGMNSGVMAFIVVTVLVILVAGFCIMFIFMRRRRRKQTREVDIGISYENPYYEETKAPLNSKKNNGDTDGETDVYSDDAARIACRDKDEGAVGFTVSVTAKKGTERNPSPLFRARPKCVMNNYDTSPALNTHVPVGTNKKGSDKKNHLADYKPVAEGADQTLARPILLKEVSDYYDKVQPNNNLTYDVPLASSYQHYENNELDNTDDVPDDEEMYYNYYDENIYESVDSLQTMVEQQRHSQTEELYAQNKKDNENRYVPFPFDGPKKS